jgi:predicted aspartyl protease
VEISCTINNVQIIGLLDTGANVSVIDEKYAKQNNWEIESVSGEIILATIGKAQPRVGRIKTKVVIGSKTVETNLEVVSLSGGEKLLVGMDLFKKFNFQLRNIPFTWPTAKEKEVTAIEEKNKLQLSAAISEDGVADDWRGVLERNQAISVSAVCKLPGSTLSINTGDAKPVWIRQYPIAQGLMEKVKQRVDEWINNGWIIKAPKGCQ